MRFTAVDGKCMICSNQAAASNLAQTSKSTYSGRFATLPSDDDGDETSDDDDSSSVDDREVCQF